MTSASPESSAPSDRDQIDRLCDEFESALQRGDRPRIEDYLPRVPEAARQTLLTELLGLELEILHRPGETLPLAPYYLRFPQAAAAIDALRAEWALEQGDEAGFEVSPVANRLEETIAFTDKTQRFRHFELKALLGRGGFGIVWHAKDTRLQRDVALKFPREETLAEIDKSLFLREARAAAKLKHPHIVAVYEISDDERFTYIVSELVDGQSLKDCLQTESFTPRDAAALVAKLAMALHHAHQAGIVHRDLKPANVLLDRNREPHIADFGLAKRETGEESLSVAGHLMGTPMYMAPEQATGDHQAVDARTDIYALGVILYELLTGKTPFRGELSLLLRQIRDLPPVPPRTLKPDLPKDLEAICLKCLEKDRAKRYPTAHALADDLYAYLNGESLRGIPAPMHDRAWKWLRRHRRQVLFASVVFTVALLTAGLLAWSLTPPPPPSELRTVEFRTEPKGCEITAVMIDPDRGEPDPTKIQLAKGVTPLTMKLAPGDYLVVAVLPNDETWFHEVYRHVPGQHEKASLGGHLEWNLNSQGVLAVPRIEIPRPEITKEMVLIEGSDRIIELSEDVETSRGWHIPSFYVDRQEISKDDMKLWKNQGDVIVEGEESPYPLFRQLNWVDRMETIGKRLPSAAELYYLSVIVCPNDGNDVPNRPSVRGLHVDPWEWTTTRPGGPFSGFPPSLATFSEVLTFAPRMIGCGDPIALMSEAKTRNESLARKPFRIELEYKRGVAGGRGVRSAKARRTPQDFLSATNSQQSASNVR